MFDFGKKREGEELETREEVPADHDDVEETISQFQACAMEIILQPWKETLHDD